MVIAVDRGTCQAKKERVGESRAHFRSEVAFLRAVGFVHQQDYVVTSVNYLTIGKVSELEDSGNEDFPHLDFLFEFFLR